MAELTEHQLLIKKAMYICCPMCDEKKCVGRFECKEISDFIRRHENVQTIDNR